VCGAKPIQDFDNVDDYELIKVHMVSSSVRVSDIWYGMSTAAVLAWLLVIFINEERSFRQTAMSIMKPTRVVICSFFSTPYPLYLSSLPCCVPFSGLSGDIENQQHN